MPTITVNVADFTAGIPIAGASADVARALPDTTGTTVISTRPQHVTLPGGSGQFQVDPSVAYRLTLNGVPGMEAPFLFATTVACSAAELFRLYRLDPATLAPLPAAPTVLAALQAETTRALTAEALLAPLASPALTGIPTAPTASAGDSSLTIATTAFVAQAIAAGLLKDLPQWQPNTAYTSGSLVVNPAGQIVQANNSFTSGSTFNAANWTVLSLTVAAVQAMIAAQAASDATTYSTLAQALLGWAYAQSYQLVSATRNSNEAITSASVVWPDGATGTFTSDTLSTSFPGAIDAYHVTHVLGGVTKTVTQTAVTRDSGGAVTAQPALTVV